MCPVGTETHLRTCLSKEPLVKIQGRQCQCLAEPTEQQNRELNPPLVDLLEGGSTKGEWFEDSRWYKYIL